MKRYEIVRSWEVAVIRLLVLSLREDGYLPVIGRAPGVGEFRLYRSRGAKTIDARAKGSKARGMFCCMWVPRPPLA